MLEPTVCVGGQNTTANRGMQVVHCILNIIIHVNLITSSSFFLFLEFLLFLGWEWGEGLEYFVFK